MTFEERQYIRQRRSDIQREKEKHVRIMHVLTPWGAKLYMGGDSRPEHEQVRSGYPIAHLPDE
jgi:hypothetical protein